MDAVIKRISIIVILAITALGSKAQNPDSLLNKFKVSFTEKIIYPYQLTSACEATSALLQINVNEQGKVYQMNISKSVETPFLIEFIEQRKNFDLVSLQSYVDLKKYKSIVMLLPVNYYFTGNVCMSSHLKPELQIHYFDFESGVPVSGKIKLLPPLNFSFVSEEVK